MTEDSAGEDSTGEDTSAYSQCNSTFDALIETMHKSSELNVHEVSAAFLEAAKCALTNQLMQEFWVRFDKEWMGKFITCAANESTSTPASSQRASSSAQVTIPKRQRREDGDDKSSSDENGRAHKRPIPQKMPPECENFALSCPFRKYDSQKYRVPDYKACALSSWKTIGRVKEHIYRCHRVPIHCTRCWTVFKNHDLLVSHSQYKTNLCPARPMPVLDGITTDTEKLIRSRKKDYRGQPDPELWRKLYRTIFPDEPVPSPYYEMIRDETADHSDINYEYVRRELPRIFRPRLRSVINSEYEPIEDAVRAQVDGILQGSIDQLWINYENTKAIRDANEIQPATAVRTTIQSMSSRVFHTHKQDSSTSSSGSVPELQPMCEYFNTIDQSPGPPPTPGDPTLPYEHCSSTDTHLAYINQHAPPGCFCPLNACNCPNRQRQPKFLPPAAFEFNTPGKTREKRAFSEEWNAEGLLVTAGFGIDDFSMDWDL